MRVAYITSRFPLLSETFILYEIVELERRGFEIVIASQEDPREKILHPEAAKLHERTFYYYRSLPVRALYGLLWAARSPARFLRALLTMRSRGLLGPFTRALPLAHRLRREDVDHLHAHFAGDAAETAMGCALLLGLPYSFTAHAHDIFVGPRALREKYENAAFTVTVCEYNRRYLEETLGPAAGEIHMVVCCVDPTRFERKTPYRKSAPPKIVAVGRLVEKKGFADLVDALGLLRRRGVFADLEIVGTGPLEAALKERAKAAGVGDAVRFLGALPHAEVRRRLEEATLFSLPFVVAADGDRDSMPVVVKEAMAMRIPIVSTREVGVPEMVLPGCGELVEPRRPDLLAEALERMLAKSKEELEAIGARGRETVALRFDIRREVAKLGALFVRYGRKRSGAKPVNLDPDA